MKIERKQDSLLRRLKDFYKDEKNMKKLVNVLEKEGDLSRRVLDYLCTNYSKKNDVTYFLIDSNGRRQPFNLHANYRNQLKAYSKMLFDPFRRHERITIACPFSEKKKLETTVAQLNFFKWAIESKVLDWINKGDNLKKVDEDMAKAMQDKKSKPTTKKKREICKSLNKVSKAHNVKITVSFV